MENGWLLGIVVSPEEPGKGSQVRANSIAHNATEASGKEAQGAGYFFVLQVYMPSVFTVF